MKSQAEVLFPFHNPYLPRSAIWLGHLNLKIWLGQLRYEAMHFLWPADYVSALLTCSPPSRSVCLQLRVRHGACQVPQGVRRPAGGHRALLWDGGEVRPPRRPAPCPNVRRCPCPFLKLLDVSPRALKLGYLTQDMIDDYEPALMFTIPRLAIVW